MQQEYSCYFELLCAIYSDIASAYPAQNNVEFKRDLAVMRNRFKCEGVSFLTKTLPSLVKAVDLALANGTNLHICNFARRRRSSLPRFLGWLLGMVFHDDGTERANACPVALRHIRQFSLFYKLELPMTSEQSSRVIEKFVAVDESLKEVLPLSAELKRILRTAQKLVCRVLACADPRQIQPRHGNGAVATGERPHEKPFFRRFFKEIDRVYPYTEYFYYNYSHLCDSGSSLSTGLSLHDSSVGAKIALVPKDSRGPRLISMEPLEKQWIQQGQMALMVDCIQKCWLTRGRVNFTDQKVNQRLAVSSSLSGDLVTIDMEDASDRVSTSLVDILFPETWVEALYASRSSTTTAPNGTVIRLNKFASMGSAVCFPVEALIFWAIAVSVLVEQKTPIRSAIERVFVYGDDIIIPRKDYLGVINAYHSLHLRVNKGKCCTGPRFRESCGVDAYNGVDVTPIRVKRRWRHQLLVRPMFAWVSLSNSLHERGYENASLYVEKLVHKVHRIPYSNVRSPALTFVRPLISARECVLRNHGISRYSRKFHRYEVRSLVPVPARRKQNNHGWEHLLDVHTRCYSASRSTRETEEWEAYVSQTSGSNADYYPIPHRVSLKCGWNACII